MNVGLEMNQTSRKTFELALSRLIIHFDGSKGVVKYFRREFFDEQRGEFSKVEVKFANEPI